MLKSLSIILCGSVAWLVGCPLALGASPKVDIAIIGTGHVGGTLGIRLAKAGHRVTYGSLNPEDPAVRALVARSGKSASAVAPAIAASRAEVIMLAVPWASAETAVKSLGDLHGKILIDPTNPLGHDEKTNLAVEFSLPMAGAELIQSWAPGSRVVKVFDTTSWLVLANPHIVPGPVSIPIASDDPGAKQLAMDLARELGFDPFDAGNLHNAKLIEGMALLYIRGKHFNGKYAYEYYLRPRRLRSGSPGEAPE
jgi:predicted dinucleotide-binding enzyme